MNNQKLNIRFGIIVAIIAIAAASRFIAPEYNFSPIGAIVLFSAAYFIRKAWAIIIPFLAIWASSLYMNNVVYAEYFDSFAWFSNPGVYVAFALVAMIGFVLLKKVNFVSVTSAALAGAIVFFLVTNFFSWVSMPEVYTRDFSGLMQSYAAGVPFFRGTLLSNLVYCGALFGSFELMKANLPQLIMQKQTNSSILDDDFINN